MPVSWAAWAVTSGKKYISLQQVVPLRGAARGVREHGEDFEIVLVDSHFHVKAGEFAQVPVSVGIFRAEHGPNLENTLETTAGAAHLLEQLWRLRKARVFLKVR